MNLFFLSHRFRRLNLPGAMLLALLQRTPVVRVVTQAETVIIASPVGNVLRAAITAVASLGAMHSLAGATPLVASPSSATSGLSTTVGANVSVAYTVNGTQTPPASWRINGTIPPGLSFSGRTTAGIVNVQDLTLTGSPTTAGTYNVTLTAYEGPSGTLTPSPDYPYQIVVTGGSTDTAPTITTQPQNVTVNVGGSATFSVAANGSPSPGYQWRKDGSNLSGQTSSTLSLTNVQTTNAGTYTVVVSNTAGSVTSNGATLTVNVVGSAPAFTLQPMSQTIASGSTVVFNAAATGATSFKWQRNGVDIGGATSTTLVIGNATAGNAGTYTAVATNSTGSTTSSSATLSVTTASAVDTGHLINLSVRTNSGTGDQVLAVGFVVGGANTTGTKSVLVRVTGPALEPFGVSGWMADPTLELRPLGSTTVLGSNDNWGGNATIVTTAAAVGAFPIVDTNSKDAAAVLALSGGPYTTLAAGKNNTTGAVLTEIYDSTPVTSFTATTPRLINVSARAQVNTGDDVLFTGFVVGGSTSKTLLVRATGPALAAYGVGGALADPKLELFILNGPKLYENDNWGGSAILVDAASSVGAFDIPDRSSKDAVLLVTLPPGNYTAKITGVNNGTGIALVEVYDVP